MSVIAPRPEVPIKPWYFSRVLWVNVLATAAIIAQAITGRELFNIEAQAGILAVINLILRLRTNQGLE